MIGMMTWTPLRWRPAKSVALETRALLHLRVAWASVARAPGHRRPGAAAGADAPSGCKAGVTRLVVPEAFAYGERLEKVGVAPVSALPLRRALAADLARAVMAGRNLSGGSARLAVAGDQLSGELVRTVTELALGNRYVLLDVPYGGDTLPISCGGSTAFPCCCPHPAADGRGGCAGAVRGPDGPATAGPGSAAAV
ncbi:MAG: hypothetical protein ACLTYN_05525 [Dysosmobacter welbionis]